MCVYVCMHIYVYSYSVSRHTIIHVSQEVQVHDPPSAFCDDACGTCPVAPR